MAGGRGAERTERIGPVVTPANVETYLEAVLEAWVGRGVERQVEAFRQGIDQVFDWRALLSFSSHELANLMCGGDQIVWTDKTLRKLLKPSSGFSHDSPTMKVSREAKVDFGAGPAPELNQSQFAMGYLRVPDSRGTAVGY